MSRIFIGVAALLVLTVTTGYAATPLSGLEADSKLDRVVAQHVYDALSADPIYYFRHVDVYVRDGVVTLSGIVWDPQDIYRARELTARVPGVVSVINQIELNVFARE